MARKGKTRVAGVLTPEERAKKAVETQKRLEAENWKLRVALDRQVEAYKGMRGLIAPAPKYKCVYRPRAKRARPKIEAMFGMADEHVGAFSHPAQSSGRIDINYDLIAWGLLDITDRWCRDVAKDLEKYDITTIHVMVAGDIVNGELRKDDLVSNEFPPPVQTLCAGNLLSAIAGRISAQFPDTEIIFHCIAGNHDRIDEKPGNHDAMNRSHALNVYVGMQLACQRLDNVQVIIYQDQQPTIEYRPGKFFVMSHGHGIKMNKRMPWYGMRDAFMARVLEAMDYKGPPPDFMTLAHFHQFGLVDDGRILAMPSGMGPSLFSRNAGFRGVPAQVTWYTSEHGMFGHIPWRRRIPPNYVQAEYEPPWEKDLDAIVHAMHEEAPHA